jgi:hypothetical protein
MMFGRVGTDPTVRPFGCSPGGGETTTGLASGAVSGAGRAAYQPPSAAKEATATAPATRNVRTVGSGDPARNTLHENTAADARTGVSEKS